MPLAFDHAHRPFQSGQPTTPAELDTLEHAAAATLPEDYKAFLLKLNGGSVLPFAFVLEIPGTDFQKQAHALDYFYEVREIHRRSQLKMDPALRNIPPGRLAIGTTVSNLTITLRLADNGYGQVEAWVRNTFNVWGEGTNHRIVHLADSFTAFLMLLHTLPEVYNPFWACFGQDGETARRVALP